MQQQLNKKIIHKSLYKPILFVGCERAPFTIIITICGVFMMLFPSFIMFIAVIIFYMLSLIGIRKINEADSQFFQCLYRYVRFYQDYYPANAFYPGRVDKPKSLLHDKLL
ncbi:MAG: VirB3 family type IV secretion system protein [Burkholderiales bacterium]|jgi:type IV secretory pathway TrbD component|nr:VirB3 family type IV secretion system protein [Burkholderiales bacterium]